MASWDLRRFRGLAVAGGLVGVLAVGMNLALLVAFGPAPTAMVSRQMPMEWDDYQGAESRAAALGAAIKADPDARPDLVYLGMSSAREGFVLSEFERPSGCFVRVAGVTGRGGGMEQMRALAEPLLRRNIRPDLVVLAVHPAFFVGRPTERPPVSLNPIVPAAEGDWRDAVGRLKWWIWIKQNRTYVNYAIMTGYARAKTLAGTLPSVDPWQPPPLLGYREHAGDAFLREQMTAFEGYGWFDERTLARERPAQSAELRRLVDDFTAGGSRVAIVLMPESEALRTRVPESPTALLRGALSNRATVVTPPILDMRAAIPDHAFSDHSHLNSVGRHMFSRQLAATLCGHAPRAGGTLP